MVMVPVLAGGLNTDCSRAATEKCRNLIHRDGSRWRRRRKALPWVMDAGIKPPLPIYKCVIVTRSRLWLHICFVLWDSAEQRWRLYTVCMWRGCCMSDDCGSQLSVHAPQTSAICMLSRLPSVSCGNVFNHSVIETKW